MKKIFLILITVVLSVTLAAQSGIGLQAQIITKAGSWATEH